MAGRLTRERLVAWGLPLALATLVVAPLLLGRGYALVGDMVFVPDQPWKDRWLGLDGSVPRAVPSDALVWLLGRLVPGDVVQELVLLGTLFAAGAGAARLTAAFSLPARSAAVVLAIWNPYVHERLAIGHWALLVGYAALPWVVVAALRCRSGARWPTLVLPLAVAAWTSPTGGVLALLVALAVLAPCWRLVGSAAAVGTVVNLPWILPGLATAGAPADEFGVTAFAARADTPFGVLGSLLGLGGIWKESATAPGRGVALLGGTALLLSLLALLGTASLVRRGPHRQPAGALLAVGLLGVLLALAPATPAVGLVEWVVTDVPGGGLLRDSQKWVALLLPALLLGLAAVVDRLGERLGSPTAPGVALALVPVAVLPGLAWGLLGTLSPATYPDDWHAARDVLQREAGDGARSVVLPFGLYRRFDWNHGHAVLDPLPRFLPGEVLTDDALVVEDGVVAGEDALAAEVRAVADDPEQLAALLRSEGIGWLVVHLDDGIAPAGVPAGEVVHAGSHLAVLRLSGAGEASRPERSWWIAAADLLAVTGLLCAVAHTRRRPEVSSAPGE